MAGAEGSEAQLGALWEAEDEDRVGDAVRDEGLERRPRDRNAARPDPSGRMNFSRSSRLVRPRAGGGRRVSAHYRSGGVGGFHTASSGSESVHVEQSGQKGGSR